jgi:hypothetical protein
VVFHRYGDKSLPSKIVAIKGTFFLLVILSIDKNKKRCKIGSRLPNKKGVFYEI